MTNNGREGDEKEVLKRAEILNVTFSGTPWSVTVVSRGSTFKTDEVAYREVHREKWNVSRREVEEIL